MLSQTAHQFQKENPNWKTWFPKRGDIYLADLGDGIDSEQRGLRPVVVVSNDMNNKHSSILQFAPITSQKKTNLPVHIPLGVKDGLKTDSVVCVEQIRTISKKRALVGNTFIKIVELDSNKMKQIDFAIKLQFGLK